METEERINEMMPNMDIIQNGINRILGNEVEKNE